VRGKKERKKELQKRGKEEKKIWPETTVKQTATYLYRA
jgi:hypothetical protein